MMEKQLFVLSWRDFNRQIEICENEMIHVTWKDMTFSLNVTGLIQLARFLDSSYQGELSRYFVLSGNLDDGFELWIHNIVLPLSGPELRSFRYLIEDALLSLKYRTSSLHSGTVAGILKFNIAMDAMTPSRPSLN